MSAPYNTVFWCFLMLSAGVLSDAVLSGQLSQNLCVLCSYSQTERIPFVFCSNFVILVSILNSRCDKCTRRNRSESQTCPIMKDQRDFVLDDLEELGGKEFLLKNRNNIEILFLFLPPSCNCAFPLSIRTMRMHKLVPKIIFPSPEFNRSIIFSMWQKYVFLWFCFSLWSTRRNKYIRLYLWGFLLVVVVLLVAQVRDQLIQWENADPRMRMVFEQSLNSNFHSIFTL